jgi:hypothetical protein
LLLLLLLLGRKAGVLGHETTLELALLGLLLLGRVSSSLRLEGLLREASSLRLERLLRHAGVLRLHEGRGLRAVGIEVLLWWLLAILLLTWTALVGTAQERVGAREHGC